MEIFVIVKRNLLYIGFSTENPSIGQLILRAVNVLSMVYGTVAQLWYLAFVATTFDERAEAFAGLNLYLYNDFIYMIFLWKWGEIWQLLQAIQSNASRRAL